MKVLVIGDSHGNIANLKHVCGFGKKVGVEAVIHTGDWDNIEAVNEVYSYDDISVYGVRGNADISPEMISRFPDFLDIQLDNRKIAIVHDPHDIYKYEYNNWDIVFNGHYHSQSVGDLKKNGNKYHIVQPGSLEKNIRFAIYDTITNDVEFIHE